MAMAAPLVWPVTAREASLSEVVTSGSPQGLAVEGERGLVGLSRARADDLDCLPVGAIGAKSPGLRGDALVLRAAAGEVDGVFGCNGSVTADPFVGHGDRAARYVDSAREREDSGAGTPAVARRRHSRGRRESQLGADGLGQRAARAGVEVLVTAVAGGDRVGADRQRRGGDRRG